MTKLIAHSTLGNSNIAVVENEQTGNPTIYQLVDFKNIVLTQLQMQDGAPPENGFCIEDLLEIVQDQIRYLNSALPSPHNLEALQHIDYALVSLQNRFKERAAESK